MRNLQFLSLSRLPQTHLAPEPFMDFSVDLEELHVIKSDLAIIKNHAFRHVRGLKTLNLSENKITHIENEAFSEVMFCCKAYGVDDGINGCYILEGSHCLLNSSVIACVLEKRVLRTLGNLRTQTCMPAAIGQKTIWPSAYSNA